MLFEETIEPRCAYCRRSCELDEDQVLCIKRGIVSPGFHCRAFRYDPLKRIPPRPATVDFSRLTDEEFSL